MTNLEIYDLYQSLSSLSYRDDIILPVKIGYICLKDKKLLEPYYQAIDELRTQIIKEYATLSDGDNLKVPEDKIDEANNKLQEILDMEENNINIQKINVNDIQESIPMDILAGLMPILIEWEE